MDSFWGICLGLHTQLPPRWPPGNSLTPRDPSSCFFCLKSCSFIIHSVSCPPLGQIHSLGCRCLPCCRHAALLLGPPSKGGSREKTPQGFPHLFGRDAPSHFSDQGESFSWPCLLHSSIILLPWFCVAKYGWKKKNTRKHTSLLVFFFNWSIFDI